MSAQARPWLRPRLLGGLAVGRLVGPLALTTLLIRAARADALAADDPIALWLLLRRAPRPARTSARRASVLLGDMPVSLGHRARAYSPPAAPSASAGAAEAITPGNHPGVSCGSSQRAEIRFARGFQGFTGQLALGMDHSKVHAEGGG